MAQTVGATCPLHKSAMDVGLASNDANRRTPPSDLGPYVATAIGGAIVGCGLTLSLMVVHAEGIDFPLVSFWLRWADFVAIETTALALLALVSIFAFSSSRDESKALPILAAIGLGILGTVAMASIYNALCGNWFVGEPVCMGRKSGPPWYIFTGALAAPSAVLTWYWRAVKNELDLKHAAEGLASDRMAKALELLSTPETAMGAVHLIARLGRDSEVDRQPAVQTLMAYVRELRPVTDEDEEHREPPSPAVVAAIRVVGELHDRHRRINWFRCDFRAVELQECELGGADLGHCDLRRSLLTFANLSDAQLHYAGLWKANLVKANLEGAKLQFAQMRGSKLMKANLVDANLRHAELIGANFVGADLTRADLCGADLSNAKLNGAKLDYAKHDLGTTWPADFDWRATGAVFEETDGPPKKPTETTDE